MDHYFDNEQQQGGTPLTLLLGSPQGGEDPVTESILRDELSKMAEIVSVRSCSESVENFRAVKRKRDKSISDLPR